MQSRTNFFLIRVLPFIIILGGVGIVLLLFLSSDKQMVSGTVRTIASLHDTDFDLRVAQNSEDRRRGLSGSVLAENEGMLFIFGYSDYHTLWMKDMLISLDMVWMDASYTVVHIFENVHPETFPNVFTPKEKALYILELPAGTVYRTGLEIGDIVEIGL